jgi:hypothetical protein
MNAIKTAAHGQPNYALRAAPTRRLLAWPPRPLRLQTEAIRSQKGDKAMRLILLSALILVGLGTTLYQVKTGIDERQDRLQQLELRIANTKRDIAVLEAEWAYLSRPRAGDDAFGRSVADDANRTRPDFAA